MPLINKKQISKKKKIKPDIKKKRVDKNKNK